MHGIEDIKVLESPGRRGIPAFCLTVIEIVEIGSEHISLGKPEDFRDWGRKWGTDDPAAQPTQNQ